MEFKFKLRFVFPFAAVIVAVVGAFLWNALPRELAKGEVSAKDLTPLASVAFPEGEAIEIVRGSFPRLRVIAEDKPSFVTAAKDLISVIGRMTGCELKLQIVPSGSKSFARTGLFIGDVTESKVLPLSDASKERFRVIAEDGRILFLGRADHAVYDWMERQLGVRWYWPSDDAGIYIPHTRGLSVPCVDYSDEPRFAMRINAPYESTRWNRFAKGGSSHGGWLKVHAPHAWNGEADAVSNRTIFARKFNGRRGSTPLLCYGNPLTLEYYKKRIEEHINGQRDSGGVVSTNEKIVTVSQWDSRVECSCNYCRRLVTPGLGRDGDASGIIWGYFTTELSKWLKEKYPDYRICCLAYLNTAEPMPGIDFSGEGNVEVTLCSVCGMALFKNGQSREREERRIRDWHKATGRKVISWNYSCWPSEYTVAPYLYGKTIRRHLADMREHLGGVFVNGPCDMPRNALSLYVWMRCLWNPDLDVDAVYDGFAERMFGKAAKPMRELLSLQEEGWNAQWPDDECSSINIHRVSYPPSTVREMKRLMAEAEALAEGESTSLKNLEAYKAIFDDFFTESAANEMDVPIKRVSVKRSVSKPRVDGNVSEAEWSGAVAESFIDALTGEAVTHDGTQMRSLWTDNGLYLAFRCFESELDHMDFAETGEDSISGDYISVVFAPYAEDSCRRYVITIDNRRNTRIFSTDVIPELKGIRYAIGRDIDAWNLELFIPASAFPAGNVPACGKSCRLNATRFRGHRGSQWTRLSTRFTKWNRDTSAMAELVFEK